MRNLKSIFLFLLVITLILPGVNATGTCELDKFEYHPGETATFFCSCTTNQEENAVGNIVWRNVTNDILQNTSTNSGSCRTGIFGDAFVFPMEANYTGNTTFETADAAWIGDVISDDFIVDGPFATNCIVENILASSQIDVGGTGAISFSIKDGISEEKIVHASCIVHGDDINGAPLVFEPTTPGDQGFHLTTADGQVGFSHKLTENFWTTNTTYIFEILCFSLPAANFTDIRNVGWLEDSGNAAGMKTCRADALFTTSNIDLRPEENLSAGQGVVILGILLVTMFIALMFFLISFSVNFIPTKLFLIAMGVVFTIFALGISVSLIGLLLKFFNGTGDVFVQMYVLLSTLALAGFIGFVIYALVRAIKAFRLVKGFDFKDENEEHD